MAGRAASFCSFEWIIEKTCFQRELSDRHCAVPVPAISSYKCRSAGRAGCGSHGAPRARPSATAAPSENSAHCVHTASVSRATYYVFMCDYHLLIGGLRGPLYVFADFDRLCDSRAKTPRTASMLPASPGPPFFCYFAFRIGLAFELILIVRVRGRAWPSVPSGLPALMSRQAVAMVSCIAPRKPWKKMEEDLKCCWRW